MLTCFLNREEAIRPFSPKADWRAQAVWWFASGDVGVSNLVFLLHFDLFFCSNFLGYTDLPDEMRATRSRFWQQTFRAFEQAFVMMPYAPNPESATTDTQQAIWSALTVLQSARPDVNEEDNPLIPAAMHAISLLQSQSDRSAQMEPNAPAAIKARLMEQDPLRIEPCDIVFRHSIAYEREREGIQRLRTRHHANLLRMAKWKAMPRPQQANNLGNELLTELTLQLVYSILPVKDEMYYMAGMPVMVIIDDPTPRSSWVNGKPRFHAGQTGVIVDFDLLTGFPMVVFGRWRLPESLRPLNPDATTPVMMDEDESVPVMIAQRSWVKTCGFLESAYVKVASATFTWYFICDLCTAGF